MRLIKSLVHGVVVIALVIGFSAPAIAQETLRAITSESVIEAIKLASTERGFKSCFTFRLSVIHEMKIKKMKCRIDNEKILPVILGIKEYHFDLSHPIYKINHRKK